MSNAFFFNHIMPLGGTESFLYYLSKKYKDRDITVYYKTGDPQQLTRLMQYVKVQRINENEIIKCKKAFFNYSVQNIDKVEAEEYILVIHADYKTQDNRAVKHLLHPKINRYIAVSQTAADGWTELTGKPCEVCYNPISLEGEEKPLVLMSATRLSEEKGKERIEKLAKRLELEYINYIWFIFTSDVFTIKNDNIIYCHPRMDVTQLMPLADVFVQLSRAEGYCYSVVEANMQNVPCLTTPLNVFDEIGIKGIRLDFDIENVPIEKIINLKRIKYTPPADRWGEILTPDKSNYKPPKKQKNVTVTVTRDYLDIFTGREEKRGSRLIVNPERAKQLIAAEVAI